MTPFRRILFSVLGLVLMPLLCIAAHALPLPENLQAFDDPNDSGTSVSLTWPKMSYDEEELEYIVLMSDREGGPHLEVDRFTSNRRYESDRDRPFWVWDRGEDDHLVTVSTYNGYVEEDSVDSFDETRKALAKVPNLVRTQKQWDQIAYVFQEGEGKEARVIADVRLIRGPARTQNGETTGKLAIEGIFQKQVQQCSNALKEHLSLVPLKEERKIFSIHTGRIYYFRLDISDGVERVESSVVSAIPKGNFFNWLKVNNLIFMVLFGGIVLAFIGHAKRKTLFLRRIPGLNAVDEAIGRATEMGKPIYFLTGRLGMASVSTIAATTILGEIAKRVAQYDAQLRVPHTDPIVMAVCQEIVREAYIEAGRPDAYQEDINFFVTTEQFSYTAAVDGMMVRERPAACFFMGFYYAESLLLAEVGASIGAIQVAGTDAEHQLPFFVTACDYTLIGEELYAASAYLSHEPVLVGTLRGQDIGKSVVMAFIFFGAVIATLGLIFGAQDSVASMLQVFTDF